MTLPIERTRALCMGGELLRELQSADNLSAEARGFLSKILEHYPSLAEIDTWARTGPLALSESPLEVRWLAPETTAPAQPSDPMATPRETDRPPATPERRMQSVLAAGAFLHGHSWDVMNLTDEQRRKLAVVARHFPNSDELLAMAQREGTELTFNSSEDRNT